MCSLVSHYLKVCSQILQFKLNWTLQFAHFSPEELRSSRPSKKMHGGDCVLTTDHASTRR